MRTLILVLSLMLGGLSRGQSAPETIPQIQVTHTWGDLLKTKPLTVESDKVIYPGAKQAEPGKPVPVSVQVGIDRDRATNNGAVLLYCMAKGVSFSRTSDHDLGPFQVKVEAPGPATLADAMQQADAHAENLHDSTYLLFTKSVPLGGTGNYVIELIQTFKPNAKTTSQIIAKIEMTVSGEPVLPWSPWDESDKEEEVMPQGADNHYVSMTVCNPDGGIAVPKAPYDFIPYQEAPVHETPLPQLIPDQPDPQTQLKLVGNTLIVTTGQDVLTDSPDDNFLTRWWVNDKPYVPGPNASHFQRARAAGAAMMANIKEVRFELDFHPERLRAKKGDKIGLQVLYCPEGWQMCRGQLELLNAVQERVLSAPPASFSFPSNRIDFIYSGDPKNLQQK